MWKSPKGTFDLCNDSYNTIETLLINIQREFVRNGGEPLETPVFERLDVLLGKYGEEADNKLIYKLADEGGEALGLRYDLTVPFVRYVKENNVSHMRRYSIGKVYRRDQPIVSSGRYREFYQADFDVLGESQDNMLVEATLLNMVCNILDKYDLTYTILVNDVTNLKHMLLCELGVPQDKWKHMCTLIDKLDKVEFSKLQNDFLTLYPEIDLPKLKMLLETNTPLDTTSKQNFSKLMNIAKIWNFDSKIRFANHLARGLDYYDGFIWEVKLNSHSCSIAAGGRYDSIIGKPMVGVSIGVSRLCAILDVLPKVSIDPVWTNTYFVCALGNIPLDDKLMITDWIRKKYNDANVLFTFGCKDKKLIKIMNEALKKRWRYIVIIAENEWIDKKIIVKDLCLETQSLVSLVSS